MSAGGKAVGWYQLGAALTRAKRVRPYRLQPDDPPSRRLSIFTQDPEKFRDGGVEHLGLPYEPLKPGPEGGVIRVFDYDGHQVNSPVDLEDSRLLLNGGLDPSPGNPQFHQQMTYGICSWLYDRFRRGLGREIEWGFDASEGDDCVRLVVSPHDVEAGENAFYDPARGALRFGYFRASERVYGRNIPNRIVFTCLSHDIVVHECTHALLDGLRTNFSLPTGPDVLAFHEGFADLVAILTHFSHRDVVATAIRASGGNALKQSLLADLARQFAHTTGTKTALRSAIDADPSDPTKYNSNLEPHALGSVLVSAVFEAFQTVWQRKIERLFRIIGRSGDTTGMLPSAMEELLTDHATTLAEQFLSICIRAIDYCPVVDIELGEYLRALITADRALVSDDPFGYRDALIDAFSVREVYPPGVGSFAEDLLLWSPPAIRIPTISAMSFAELRFDGDPGNLMGTEGLLLQAHALGAVLSKPDIAPGFGLALPEDPKLHGDEVGPPTIESIRSCRRIGPDDQVQFDSVAEITQRRRLRDGFEVYGGCTVLIDPWGRIRYTISKNVVNEQRIQAQRDWIEGRGKEFWSSEATRLVPNPQMFRLVHERAQDRQGAQPEPQDL